MCFCTLHVTRKGTTKVLDYGTENLQWIFSEGDHTTLVGADPTSKLNVEENLDDLLDLLSGSFVKCEDREYGYIGVNKYYVKAIRPNRSGKAVLFTTTNLAFYLEDDYDTIRALFETCGDGGAGSVAVDNVTIIKPGDILQVGVIDTDNIADEAVTYDKIQEIGANRFLGRTLLPGTVEEVTFNSGTGVTLTFGPGQQVRWDSSMQFRLTDDATGILLYDNTDEEYYELKGLVAGDGIQLTDGADVEIANTGLLSAESIGAGTFALLSGIVAQVAQFKKITAGSGVAITDLSGVLTISATGSVGDAENVGTGQGVFKGLSGTTLQFYSITTSGAITATLVSDDIRISEVLTFGNGLTRSTNAVKLGGSLSENTTIDGGDSFSLIFDNLAALIADVVGSIQISSADDINIEATNGLTLSGGTQVNVGVPNGENVIIGNALGEVSIAQAYNLPTDSEPDDTLDQVSVMVWTGAGGGNTTPSFLPIESVGGVTGGANVGSGSEVFKDLLSGILRFRTVLATGGLQATQNTNDITLTDLFTAVGGLTRSTNAFRLGGTQDQAVTIVGAGFNFTLNGQAVIAMTAITSMTLTAPILTLSSADVRVGSTGATVRIADRYNMPSSAPSSTSGARRIIVWTGDGSTTSAAFEAFPDDAVAFDWQDITVDPDDAEKLLVRCTDPTGIVLTRPAPTDFLITVPTGIDITDIVLHFTAANNPGSDIYVQFDFQGTNSKGNARTVYQSLDTLNLPTIEVANKQLPAAASDTISRTNFVRYGKTTGSGVIERRITGLDPLEIYVVNFNQGNAAGNAEAILKIGNL